MARTLLDVWAERDEVKPRTNFRWASTKPPAQPLVRSGFLLWAGVTLALEIVVCIGVPNFLFSHGGKRGNDASAIGSLRTLNTAQSIYRESGKEVVDEVSEYADSLAELSAEGTDLISDVLGTGESQGYRFRIVAHPGGRGWDAEAHALTPDTGTRRYYTNQTGVIWAGETDRIEPVPLNGGRWGPPPGFRKLGD